MFDIKGERWSTSHVRVPRMESWLSLSLSLKEPAIHWLTATNDSPAEASNKDLHLGGGWWRLLLSPLALAEQAHMCSFVHRCFSVGRTGGRYQEEVERFWRRFQRDRESQMHLENPGEGGLVDEFLLTVSCNACAMKNILLSPRRSRMIYE